MEEKDFADTLWKYFELHANQRIQMMNFYIIIESLFITGYVTLTNINDMQEFKVGICIGIILISWIFYKFDMRTRSLIKNCEKAIKHLEDKYSKTIDKEIMIFSAEDAETKKTKEITYTKLMKIQFIFFAIIGVIFFINTMI